MNTDNLETAFYWVRERERIRIAKESGLDRTTDPILRTYRFCNVRREDDRGTIWIKEHIRDRFDGHPYLWWMLCAARQINWPDTLAALMANDPVRYTGAWPGNGGFSPENMAWALNDLAAAGAKVFTGAYIITAPSTKGAKKTEFVAMETLGKLWADRERFTVLFDETRPQPSMQTIHTMLMEYAGWGPFLAYQAVVDMRFTPLLEGAPDVATWAAAGPGTIRGLNRIHNRHVNQALSQQAALRELQALHPCLVKETGVQMDFSDTPNVMCEVDKYLRVKNGEGKPRALYVIGRGS